MSIFIKRHTYTYIELIISLITIIQVSSEVSTENKHIWTHTRDTFPLLIERNLHTHHSRPPFALLTQPVFLPTNH